MRYLLGWVSAVMVMTACGSSDPPVRRYHTRGAITHVSSERGELSVAIHHERIDDFEDRDGKRSHMDSMQMQFGVGSDVPQAPFVQGAKLAFDFDVRWAKQPTLLIVKAEPLDAATDLALEADAHNHKH
jgi:hypothetical protein